MMVPLYILAAGAVLAGVVFSGPDHPRNLEAIRRRGGVPVLGRLPWLDPLTPSALARAAARLELASLKGL